MELTKQDEENIVRAAEESSRVGEALRRIFPALFEPKEPKWEDVTGECVPFLEVVSCGFYRCAFWHKNRVVAKIAEGSNGLVKFFVPAPYDLFYRCEKEDGYGHFRILKRKE